MNIYLNANENPFNTVDRNLINELLFSFDYNRYPDLDYKKLKSELSRITNKKVENIIPTNGSDELIQLILLAYSKENENILSHIPTFSEYEKISNYLGRNFIGVEPKKNLKVDKDVFIQKIKEYNPKIIFLCSPNNPTGELLKEEFIEEVLNTSNNMVIVDEAYIEFSGKTNINLLDKYENLIIMRTLSKAYGLASLRVGYGLTSEKNIDFLNEYRMPYNISGISQFIATETLKLIDTKKYVENILNEKQRIIKELKKINIEYLNSESNFILIKTINNNGVLKALKENKIFVRTFNDEYLVSYIRFNIGNREENDKLLSILKDVVGNGWSYNK